MSEETADLVTFTEEILVEKIDFLCAASIQCQKIILYGTTVIRIFC